MSLARLEASYAQRTNLYGRLQAPGLTQEERAEIAARLDTMRKEGEAIAAEYEKTYRAYCRATIGRGGEEPELVVM